MNFLDMAKDDTVAFIRDALRSLQQGQRDTNNKLDAIDEKVSFTNGKVSQAMRDIESNRTRLEALDKDFKSHVKWGEDKERELREGLKDLEIEEAANHNEVKEEKNRSQRMKELFIKYVVPSLFALLSAVVGGVLVYLASK